MPQMYSNFKAVLLQMYSNKMWTYPNHHSSITLYASSIGRSCTFSFQPIVTIRIKLEINNEYISNHKSYRISLSIPICSFINHLSMCDKKQAQTKNFLLKRSLGWTIDFLCTCTYLLNDICSRVRRRRKNQCHFYKCSYFLSSLLEIQHYEI